MQLRNPFGHHLRLIILLIGLALLLGWWTTRTVIEKSKPTPKTLLSALSDRVVAELKRAGAQGEILLLQPPVPDDVEGNPATFLSALEATARLEGLGPVSSETFQPGIQAQPRVPAALWRAAQDRHPEAKNLIVLDGAPPRDYKEIDTDQRLVLSILPNEGYDIQRMLNKMDIHCAIIKRENNLPADAGPFNRFYLVLP